MLLANGRLLAVTAAGVTLRCKAGAGRHRQAFAAKTPSAPPHSIVSADWLENMGDVVRLTLSILRERRLFHWTGQLACHHADHRSENVAERGVT